MDLRFPAVLLPAQSFSTTTFTLMALAVALVASGCKGGPTEPPPAQLQVSCPASKSAESTTGDPVAVNYGVPTASGGAAPVTLTCSAADGASFPVGTTSVTCTARDAKQQTTSCGLNVTVTRVGTLSATRFMAFGDSITEGIPPSPCPVVPAGASLERLLALDTQRLRQLAGPRATAEAYPNVLKGLLASRYVTQPTTVINEGRAGETATDGFGTNDETLGRLRQRLIANGPDVLLLQEGINDINTFMLHKPERIPLLIKALRDFTLEARSRRVLVLIGTLLPGDQEGCRGAKGYDLVPLANEQIKAMAAAEGISVVDLYQGFGGVPGPYIGVDGLHPTPLGYETMAQTFLGSIRTHLEVPR